MTAATPMKEKNGCTVLQHDVPEKKKILCKERFFHGKAVPCGRLGRTAQRRALGVQEKD